MIWLNNFEIVISIFTLNLFFISIVMTITSELNNSQRQTAPNRSIAFAHSLNHKARFFELTSNYEKNF